jgi:MFS family permease
MREGIFAYPPPRRAWWLIVLLFLASVVSMLDRGVLNLVVDPVRHELALSDVDVSLLQGFAFGLFYAIVGVPLGLTADRHSRRGLILVSIAVWSLATIAGGLAQSFGELFLARILVGLGEAGLSPAAISLIADLFPPERRGRPISLFLTGQAVANGLSLSITGYLLTNAAAGHFAKLPVLAALTPWRVTFVCCGLAGIPVLVALLTTREPARRQRYPPVDLAAQVAASLRYFTASAGVFLPLYLGFALCFMGAYGSAAWAPTLLMRGFGASPGQIGHSLGALSILFSVIGPTLGGTLVDACARRGLPMAKFTILLLAPLCAIPSALAAFAPRLDLAVLLVASSSAVYAVIGTTMLTTLQSIVRPGMRGLSVALTGLANTLLAGTLGPLLIAELSEHVYRDPAGVGLSIATVVIPVLLGGSALFALAGRSLRRQQRTGGPAASLMGELERAG